MRSDRYKDDYLKEEAVDFTEAEEPKTEATQTPAEADIEGYTKPTEEKKGRFGRKQKNETTDEPAELDLTKMKKKELLEIMLAQGKEIDRLKAQVSDLEARLANREFEFDRIGSIAEASLAVTDIFKEAEEAARIYLENIRRRSEQKK